MLLRPLGEDDFPGQHSMIRYLESFAGQETIAKSTVVPRESPVGQPKTALRPTCGHSADQFDRPIVGRSLKTPRLCMCSHSELEGGPNLFVRPFVNAVYLCKHAATHTGGQLPHIISLLSTERALFYKYDYDYKYTYSFR